MKSEGRIVIEYNSLSRIPFCPNTYAWSHASSHGRPSLSVLHSTVHRAFQLSLAGPCKKCPLIFIHLIQLCLARLSLRVKSFAQVREQLSNESNSCILYAMIYHLHKSPRPHYSIFLLFRDISAGFTERFISVIHFKHSCNRLRCFSCSMGHFMR